MLKIDNLSVERDSKEILNNVNIDFTPGLHIIFGANGSGKSTLLHTIAGRYDCNVTNGDIILDGENITDLPPDMRAKHGVFIAFQSPPQIPGMPNMLFIAESMLYTRPSIKNKQTAIKTVREIAERFDMPQNVIESRGVNENFSGGQMKYNELLQMMSLQPKVAMLDEIDSGLDVDGIKTAIDMINEMRESGTTKTFIVITHYHDFAQKLNPNNVHVMLNGSIVESGGLDMLDKVQKYGFKKFQV